MSAQDAAQSVPDGFVQWGPEIPVNGKRPEWLKGRVLCDIKTSLGWRFPDETRAVDTPAEEWKWGFAAGDPNILAIRLPADHPHYQQADADTVTIKRMTEAEAAQHAREHTTGFHFGWMAACKHFGLIATPATPLDRFMAAHRTADRATAEKALEWGREG